MLFNLFLQQIQAEYGIRQTTNKKNTTTKTTHMSIAKVGFLLVDYCNVYNVFVAEKLGILLKKVKWGQVRKGRMKNAEYFLKNKQKETLSLEKKHSSENK